MTKKEGIRYLLRLFLINVAVAPILMIGVVGAMLLPTVLELANPNVRFVRMFRWIADVFGLKFETSVWLVLIVSSGIAWILLRQMGNRKAPKQANQTNE